MTRNSNLEILNPNIDNPKYDFGTLVQLPNMDNYVIDMYSYMESLYFCVCNVSQIT